MKQYTTKLDDLTKIKTTGDGYAMARLRYILDDFLSQSFATPLVTIGINK